MKIVIGCDHGGFNLKGSIIEYLKANNYEICDCGTFSTDSVDYPDYGLAVAEKVASGQFPKGIILCGTGIGISICANKVKGVRAALCHDLFTAEACAMHNNANVLAIGGRIVTPVQAVAIVDKWLNTPYEGGRHDKRLQKMKEIEDKYFK
ncbi:MAG: ribose 5-phosphate isomerase B [Clostridia bacterium]